MGRHPLDESSPYLLYMPHCSRALYESLLHTNFSPLLCKQPARVILGNDLAEYIGHVRIDSLERQSEKQAEEEFTKAKKKRKGKGPVSTPKDGVLERLGA
jgi:DnaJ family protein A protein 5